MNKIIEQTIKQLKNFWTIDENEVNTIDNFFEKVHERCMYCFQHVDNKYYRDIKEINPIHSGMWLTYLYFFSNTLSDAGYLSIADKFYYLNKIMHSIDIYHEVKLPNIFFFEHPVGSVFGRARYGNNFFAMQGCSVGGNRDRYTNELNYPIIGCNVRMFSDSKIIGKAKIGNNVTLAANAYVKDVEIPDDATVFGQSPNLIIKFLK